jgi:hypothetical protein
VVVRIGGVESDEKSVWEGMKDVVDGQVASLDVLDRGEQVDWERLDKVSFFVLQFY